VICWRLLRSTSFPTQSASHSTIYSVRRLESVVKWVEELTRQVITVGYICICILLRFSNWNNECRAHEIRLCVNIQNCLPSFNTRARRVTAQQAIVFKDGFQHVLMSVIVHEHSSRRFAAGKFEKCGRSLSNLSCANAYHTHIKNQNKNIISEPRNISLYNIIQEPG
jgi:hypothetical protein